MRNLLPSLSGGRRGDVGRENDASEMLPSELAVRMDMKTGDAEGPGEEEQGRSREKGPQDQIRRPRHGKKGVGRAKTSGCPVAAAKA